MSTRSRPHRDLIVQDVIDGWPCTIAVFIRRRMACVGCALAPFMTIADAAASYGLSAAELEAELQDEARASRAAKPFNLPASGDQT